MFLITPWKAWHFFHVRGPHSANIYWVSAVSLTRSRARDLKQNWEGQGPSGSRLEGRVRLTPDKAWENVLSPSTVVIRIGSTWYVPVRIKCVCMWQETYINSDLKTQGFIFSLTRNLDQSCYVFHKAIRDPGSIHLFTSSSLECGSHLHGPRWLPDLHASHSYSRRKGRRRAYFLPSKKGWGNRTFFLGDRVYS